MEKNVLKATVRESTGKGGCKQLRREGFIPAVVYKGGKAGSNVQIDSTELWHALHTEAGENAIITLDISDGKKKTVIVQEIQQDPVNDKFLHIDFHEISMKDKLTVKVPIAIKGEAVGVKEDNGVLAQHVWELEVECLPTAIPEHIDIHVDALAIGDALHVKDLTVEGDVKFLDDEETVVVAVVPPQKAEEAEGEEGEEGEEGAEPELIKKGKEEGEEGESSEE